MLSLLLWFLINDSRIYSPNNDSCLSAIITARWFYRDCLSGMPRSIGNRLANTIEKRQAYLNVSHNLFLATLDVLTIPNVYLAWQRASASYRPNFYRVMPIEILLFLQHLQKTVQLIRNVSFGWLGTHEFAMFTSWERMSITSLPLPFGGQLRFPVKKKSVHVSMKKQPRVNSSRIFVERFIIYHLSSNQWYYRSYP